MEQIKLNSFNLVLLEGQIVGLTHSINAQGKDEVKFMLLFYHAGKPINGKVTYYTSSMSVSFYGTPAIRVMTKYRNGDWILVEGHLRQHESGRFKIVGVHMDFTTAVFITPNSEDIKEIDNGEETED